MTENERALVKQAVCAIEQTDRPTVTLFKCQADSLLKERSELLAKNAVGLSPTERGELEYYRRLKAAGGVSGD